MNNEEFLRKKIQDAFIIKSKDGIDPQTFYESISNQMSYFLNRVPGFASANVSRGLRGILTEENRNAIETAITNIYLNYISKNKVLKK